MNNTYMSFSKKIYGAELTKNSTSILTCILQKQAHTIEHQVIAFTL